MATPTPKMTLYSIDWAFSPRRVTMAIKEKGIADHFDIVNAEVTPTGIVDPPGKPPGTFPILKIGEGRFIRQSVPILEYIEDRFPTAKSLRGNTPEEAAYVRELAAVFDEAQVWLSLWTRNASDMFKQMGHEQSKEAALQGIERAKQQLDLLLRMAHPTGPFLAGTSPTYVDFMVMSSIQYLSKGYAIDLCRTRPRLQTLYDEMATHPSTEWPDTLPDGFKESASNLSVRSAEF